jgi:small-conductance mechanosensitive channel
MVSARSVTCWTVCSRGALGCRATAALLRARQLACWLLYAAGAVLLIRSVTYAAGFYKFRTFVSLYTTLNRAAGVVLVGYLVLAALLGQGTAAWLAAAAGLSALEELVLELRAWTPAPDVRGLLWIEKPRR